MSRSEANTCYKLFNPEGELCFNLYDPETNAFYELYNMEAETEGCYKLTYLLITLRPEAVMLWLMLIFLINLLIYLLSYMGDQTGLY